MKTPTAILAACLIVSTLTVPATASDTTGLRLVAEQDPVDPALVTCRAEWLAPADEARISVQGPSPVLSGLPRGAGWTELPAAPDWRGETFVRTLPAAGDQVELFLDLRSSEAPATVLVIAERVTGLVTYQVVLHVEVSERGVEVAPPASYRLTLRPGIDALMPLDAEAATGEHDGPQVAPGSGAVVVEPIEPQLKTLATAFGEDAANATIPDGPYDCSPSNYNWARLRQISIGSAPSGSVATGFTVHVTVTHAIMAQLEIGYFKGYGVGQYLWDNGGGVNLDQDFTSDFYGQPLWGVGEAVNGQYILGLRDCTAGTTGVLVYWSVTVEYDSPAAVDLVADSVAVSPTSVEPGDDVEVQYAGHVGGSGSTGGSYWIGFYLSTDSTITSGDVLLDQVQETSANTAGETFGQGAPGRSMSIPASTADGSYFVGMLVDSTDVITESNEGNNAVATALTVSTAAADPDLVATSCSVLPTSAEPGDSVTFTWRGTNSGSAASGPFTWGVYLSSDSTINPATDTLLTSQAVAGGWAAGYDSGNQSLVVNIPVAQPDGSYFIGIALDTGGAVAESNEGNNTCATGLTIAAAAGEPNLEVVSCSLTPTSAAPGDTVTFTWRGRNSGTAASGAFTWGVYLSTDATISPGSDTLVESNSGGGWAAGYDTGNLTVSVDLASGLADGQYWLGVVLDTAGAVTESSEADNDCATALTVSSSPSTGGVTHWLVPAAASSPGFGTSDWRTQVAVVNPTADTRIANVYYVAKGAPWPGTLLSGPITLNPGQSAFLDDPLLALNPTSGALYVTLDAAGPVVTSRTLNLGDGGATYGQGIPAQPLDGVTTPTELVLPMVHSIPGQFHTNLGLVQTSAGTYQVEVTVYSSGGSLLAISSYSRSQAYDQVNDLFDDMGIGSLAVEGAWIRVRLVSGSPTYWTCYASVVDDLTGDPTYVAPVESAE